jgi:transcriptional regulator with XRE-family HTH domain
MNDEGQRDELRRFLKDRRGRIRPADVGLQAAGRRRVRGLRREEVASLAGIGVSWYTALESGDADGVSEATVRSVADALLLSESERNYLLVLTGHAEAPIPSFESSALLNETMRALSFPAYIITATWDVLDCNAAFRRLWGIDERESVPFNAVERLFLHASARKMHGSHFIENVAPVVAMIRSAIGRRPHLATLQRVSERIFADPDLRDLWAAYEIGDPLVPNTCTIQSPIGTFTYEAITLADPGSTTSALVVQVPDQSSRELLAIDMAG